MNPAALGFKSTYFDDFIRRGHTAYPLDSEKLRVNLNVDLFFFLRISWAAGDPTHSDTSLHSRSTSNKVFVAFACYF